MHPVHFAVGSGAGKSEGLPLVSRQAGMSAGLPRASQSFRLPNLGCPPLAIAVVALIVVLSQHGTQMVAFKKASNLEADGVQGNALDAIHGPTQAAATENSTIFNWNFSGPINNWTTTTKFSRTLKTY